MTSQTQRQPGPWTATKGPSFAPPSPWGTKCEGAGAKRFHVVYRYHPATGEFETYKMSDGTPATYRFKDLAVYVAHRLNEVHAEKNSIRHLQLVDFPSAYTT